MAAMSPALVIEVPATWTRIGTEYAVNGVTIAISEVQALPEDPVEWLAAEFARRGAGTPAISHVELDAGYPALVGEAETLLVVMVQLLELGAVAMAHGRRGRHDAEIRGVLMAARPRWGTPVTLADLFAGTVRR